MTVIPVITGTAISASAALWLQDQAAPAEQAQPVQQVTDARKVLPYQNDTVAVHPEALSADKTASTNKMAVVAASQPAKQAEADKGYLDKMYDMAHWVWGFVYPWSNKENVDHNPNIPQAIPEGTDQVSREELQLFVTEMRHLLAHINDVSEDEGEQDNFEAMLVDLLKAQARDREDEMSMHREKILENYSEKKRINKERLDKVDETISRVKTTKMWGMFEKMAATFGLAASAAGVATTGGAIAFCVGVGMVADELFDDFAKKKIAAWISNDTDTEDRYLGYLRLGCGVATIGIYLGLAGQQAFKTSINIAKGTATGARGILDHKNNVDRAAMTQMGKEISQNDEKVKRDGSAIHKLVDNVYNYYRTMSEIAKNQTETATSVIRQ